MMCDCFRGGASRSAPSTTSRAGSLVTKVLGNTFRTRLWAVAGLNYYQEAPTLVSPAQLKAKMDESTANGTRLHVLDCTWYLPNANRSASDEFATLGRIQGAQFFDLDTIADQSKGLPHMLPSEGAFGAAMDALGIEPEDEIVVYDRQGIFSAPRAWWTFQAFGHVGGVSVLNGGLPEWQRVFGEGFMIDAGGVERDDLARVGEACAEYKPGDPVTYQASLQKHLVKSLADIVATYEENTGETVVDARPAGRWQGTAPEPRQGLPSGHVPGSKNIPWDAVLDTFDLQGDESGGSGGSSGSYKRFKAVDEIRSVFSEAGLDLSSTDFSSVIASCGSGTTACILVLASEQLQVCRCF